MTRSSTRKTECLLLQFTIIAALGMLAKSQMNVASPLMIRFLRLERQYRKRQNAGAGDPPMLNVTSRKG